MIKKFLFLVMVLTVSIGFSQSLSACYDGVNMVAAGGDGSYTWSICDSLPNSGSCVSYTVVDMDSLYTTSSTVDEILLEDGSGGSIIFNYGISNVQLCNDTTAPIPPLSVCYDGVNLVADGGDGSYTWSVCDSLPNSGSCVSYTVVDMDSLYTTSSTVDEIFLEDNSGNSIIFNYGVSNVQLCNDTTTPIPPLTVCYDGVNLVASGGSGGYTWSMCDSIETSGSCVSYTVISTDSSYTTSSIVDQIILEDSSGGIITLNDGVSGVQSCLTSINDNLNEVSFSVYPNPTDGLVIFSFMESNERLIEIYNNNGQLIISTISNERDQKIELFQSVKGLYFYRVLERGNLMLKFQGKIVVK